MNEDKLREHIASILSEYVVWSGNDITTQNFKRVKNRLYEFVLTREAAAREEGYNIGLAESILTKEQAYRAGAEYMAESIKKTFTIGNEEVINGFKIGTWTMGISGESLHYLIDKTIARLNT